MHERRCLLQGLKQGLNTAQMCSKVCSNKCDLCGVNLQQFARGNFHILNSIDSKHTHLSAVAGDPVQCHSD